MPVTALKLPDPKSGKEKRVKFITQDFAVNLSVDIYACDENFIPQGEPTKGTHTDTEEKYHTDLRSEADKRGHFVAAESTNPEWNPGYVAPEWTPGDSPTEDFREHEPHTEM